MPPKWKQLSIHGLFASSPVKVSQGASLVGDPVAVSPGKWANAIVVHDTQESPVKKQNRGGGRPVKVGGEKRGVSGGFKSNQGEL